MSDYTLTELGWQPFFEQQVTVEEQRNCRLARVCANHRTVVSFLGETGEFSVESAMMGSMDEGTPSGSSIAVGDWFLLDSDHHRRLRRLERKTVLSRKAAGEAVKPQLIAANVDTVFIVSSCNQEFNVSRLERYLALVLESGALPIIVLTKADLCDNPVQLQRRAEHLHPGILVETLDARDPVQTQSLHGWCGLGKTVALVGSSGVGKSTLVTAMGGHSIKTGPIRDGDDKGRHTTTSRSMHRLSLGGWLIDNPGMRELQLADCSNGVAELFADLLQLADQCRFRNCKHKGDDGCALEAAVESGELERRRLISYLKLEAEQARNSTTLAQRRERDRKTGRMYKRVIADKRLRREA